MSECYKRKLPTYLCSDTHCKHNSGGMYYGVCHHSITEIDRYVGGIDRFYKSGCDLHEYPLSTNPISDEVLNLQDVSLILNATLEV